MKLLTHPVSSSRNMLAVPWWWNVELGSVKYTPFAMFPSAERRMDVVMEQAAGPPLEPCPGP